MVQKDAFLGGHPNPKKWLFVEYGVIAPSLNFVKYAGGTLLPQKDHMCPWQPNKKKETKKWGELAL